MRRSHTHCAKICSRARFLRDFIRIFSLCRGLRDFFAQFFFGDRFMLFFSGRAPTLSARNWFLLWLARAARGHAKELQRALVPIISYSNESVIIKSIFHNYLYSFSITLKNKFNNDSS